MGLAYRRLVASPSWVGVPWLVSETRRCVVGVSGTSVGGWGPRSGEPVDIVGVVGSKVWFPCDSNATMEPL